MNRTVVYMTVNILAQMSVALVVMLGLFSFGKWAPALRQAINFMGS